MVGVDVQAHRGVAFGAGVVRADRAQGFGQHHADAAVQQPERLDGALVHRHPAHQEVIADFGDFNAQVADRRARVARVDEF
ncbi:hypothetical protein D3C86_2120340 [compost metagenome]